MGADPGTAAIISSVGGLTGQVYGAEATGKLTEEQQKKQMEIQKQQLAEQSRQFGITTGMAKETEEARRKAYAEAVGRGTAGQTAGETGLMESVAKSPQELEQLKKDITSGNVEAMQRAKEQMEAGMAQAGVRGGQAATQLRRGIGEMGISTQRDINRLIAEEAMQREAAKRAYLGAKALGGQAATLRAY